MWWGLMPSPHLVHSHAVCIRWPRQYQRDTYNTHQMECVIWQLYILTIERWLKRSTIVFRSFPNGIPGIYGELADGEDGHRHENSDGIAYRHIGIIYMYIYRYVYIHRSYGEMGWTPGSAAVWIRNGLLWKHRKIFSICGLKEMDTTTKKRSDHKIVFDLGAIWFSWAGFVSVKKEGDVGWGQNN